MNVRMRVGAVVGVIVPAIVLWFATIASAQPAVDVRVGVATPTIRYALFKAFDPTFIAIEKGFFRQAGVNVKLTGSYASGPAAVQGAAFNQVDAGICATTGLIAARAAGVRVKGIADFQTEFTRAALQRFYVRSDSSIRTLRDLKGKRIAVNSMTGSFRFAMLVALSSVGLSSSDVEWVILPIPFQEQALATGAIDVAGLIDPFNIAAEKRGGVRTLTRAVNVIGQKQIALVFFRFSYLEQHPAAVRAFVRGYRRAIVWSRTHRAEANKINAKYVGVDANLFAPHWYTYNARVKTNDIAYWLAFMRQEGAVKDNGRLTPSSIATTKYTGGPPRR